MYAVSSIWLQRKKNKEVNRNTHTERESSFLACSSVWNSFFFFSFCFGLCFSCLSLSLSFISLISLYCTAYYEWWNGWMEVAMTKKLKEIGICMYPSLHYHGNVRLGAVFYFIFLSFPFVLPPVFFYFYFFIFLFHLIYYYYYYYCYTSCVYFLVDLPVWMQGSVWEWQQRRRDDAAERISQSQRWRRLVGLHVASKQVWKTTMNGCG